MSGKKRQKNHSNSTGTYIHSKLHKGMIGRFVPRFEARSKAKQAVDIGKASGVGRGRVQQLLRAQTEC